MIRDEKVIADSKRILDIYVNILQTLEQVGLCLKNYLFPTRPSLKFIINHECNRLFRKKLLLKKLTSVLTTLNLFLLALLTYRLNLLS